MSNPNEQDPTYRASFRGSFRGMPDENIVVDPMEEQRKDKDARVNFSTELTKPKKPEIGYSEEEAS